MTEDDTLVINGSVNILGDVTIDGDLSVDGEILGKSLRVEKINLDIPEPEPDGTSNASIGEATISAGQTKVVVETTAVTDKSRVFVTATTATAGQALVVIEKTARESFKVSLDSPLPTDVKFDWFIVN